MPCSQIVLKHCVPDNAREGHSKVPAAPMLQHGIDGGDMSHFKNHAPKMTVTMQVLELTIRFSGINKRFISCLVNWCPAPQKTKQRSPAARCCPATVPPHLRNGFPHPRRFPQQLIRHVPRRKATGFLKKSRREIPTPGSPLKNPPVFCSPVGWFTSFTHFF